jgi:quinol monooxygenase YgiN
MIGIIAKLSLQEGKVEEAIDLIKELMEGVAMEEGTLSYTMNQDKTDPNTIVILERYRNKADLDYHSSTPHFKAFFKKIGGLLAKKPDISIMDEIHSIR